MMKIVLFLIVCGMIPYLMGMLYTVIFQKGQTGFCVNMVYGYVILWSIFQILVIPCIFFKMKLSLFMLLYVAVVVILLLLSIIKNHKRIMVSLWKTLKGLKNKHWSLLLVVFILFVQLICVVTSNLGDLDDAFYVATAETAVATDTLMEFSPYTGEAYTKLPARYILSPFPLFVAVISQLIGVKPVTMAHTFLPICLIPLAYAVYYMIGCRMFLGKKKEQGIFMILVNCGVLFSGYSIYTQGVFLYTRIWQGKAVLAAILLPLVFYWGLSIFTRPQLKGEWGMVLATMLSCCLVSSMGIMLSAIMMGIMGIVQWYQKKDFVSLRRMFYCCIPNIIYAGIYMLIR